MKNTTTKIQKLTARLLLLTVTFIFTFCGDDGESGGPSFSYTINGESQGKQTTTGFLQSEIQYDHEGRALYLTAAAGITKMLSISVANWDFHNPPANGILTGEYDATFDFEQTDTENPLAECLTLTGNNAGVTLCDGGLVTYILNNDIYTSVFDGNTGASITITECNTGNRTVSGTFTSKVQNFDEQELTVTGSFKKVKYIVQ